MFMHVYQCMAVSAAGNHVYDYEHVCMCVCVCVCVSEYI